MASTPQSRHRTLAANNPNSIITIHLVWPSLGASKPHSLLITPKSQTAPDLVIMSASAINSLKKRDNVFGVD